jgi:transposase
MFHRWQLCHRKKGGQGVGKTKRGTGSKIMAVADRSGLPIAISVSSASPHEITLVETTLHARFTKELPERLIGDKAYDSDPLDKKLAENGVALIAPHRSKRRKGKTQDGRKLRRYRRRWEIERFFAWLQNYRRILVRFDRLVENYIGVVHLGCLIILLRHYF